MRAMRTTYDEEADVLAILLADAEVEETRSIAAGVEADYDSSGRILAIEFLNAGKKHDLRGAQLEPPDPFLSLAAAGALYDLSPTTLRHQIQRGVLPGTKFGRNWMVHRDDLNTYVGTRSRNSRGLRKNSEMAERREEPKPLSQRDTEFAPQQDADYNLRDRKGDIIFSRPVS